MKKNYLMLGVFIIVILAFTIHQYKNPKIQESITYFPIDPNVSFKTAQTILTLMNNPANTILWKEHSTLDRKAYLRQDAALLYANGRLIDQLWNWKQNTAVIEQEKRMTLDKNVLLQAITFHHAELHENENKIFSSQAMSADQTFFLTAHADNVKKQLEQQIETMLQLSWNKGLRHFSINLSNYQAYPLSEFNELAKDSLPGFTKPETAKIVGNLWEGLYKNYILGIKKAEGAIESPKGSTLPLILIATDKSHLLVLTETALGEPILLRQMMAVND
ncbi:hypothetical protein QNH48_22515 [Neobacillus sp. YX16]|uniref:hypothetical protein n=1 Tax=Neobacillus sp. YX16 TaxID=3047874 RepID=UPI0024C28E5A|nr:hypothetical protein [Neobacillus sp. YX16]WHZ01738.1 hypothetical protein QNH48_22515 [Neobacillus sp. YX16]